MWLPTAAISRYVLGTLDVGRWGDGLLLKNFGEGVSSFIWAALIKYHRLMTYNQKKLFSHSPGVWKSKVRSQHGQVTVRILFQTVKFSLYPHMAEVGEGSFWSTHDLITSPSNTSQVSAYEEGAGARMQTMAVFHSCYYDISFFPLTHIVWRFCYLSVL